MKKLYLLLFEILFSVTVLAQTWDKLTDQATDFFNKGDYAQAISFAEKGIQIAKEKYGENDPNYATAINILGMTYHMMGKDDKAEQILVQVESIRKKTLGKTDPQYANSLNNLAYLYKDLGQYQRAADLYAEALTIYKNTWGENSPNYATCLNNLALVFMTQGTYNAAENLFTDALRIRKNNFGEMSAEYAQVLANLGGLYSQTGQYEKAERFLIEAAYKQKKIIGGNPLSYVNMITGLGDLYNKMGEYRKAEPLLLEALKIKKELVGTESLPYAEALIILSALYFGMNDYAKAETLMLSSYSIVLKSTINSFQFMSDKEKGRLLIKNNYHFDYLNSCLLNEQKQKGELVNYVFNSLLYLKSLSLSDTRNMLEAVMRSNDKEVQGLLTQWSANKTFLAKQYALPPGRRVAEIKAIEDQTENIEKELNRKSVEFRQQQTAVHISSADVQKNLQEDEVAIEFVSFQYFDKKWTDSVIYAAYVLGKNDSMAVFVPLCEEKQLQKLFDSAGKTSTSMVSHFYRGIEIKNRNTANLGKELYKLVWAPLEPYLKGVKKISYSPAGKLYSIAFDALQVDSTTELMDKYQLQQYISTRQVALRISETRTTKPVSIVLFGDADFSMDSLQLVNQRHIQPDINVSTSIYTPSTRATSNNAWPDLPGTGEEVKKIQQLFDQHKIQAKVFIQASASEENLKALNNSSPQILHIATHGFFLPAPVAKKKEGRSDQGNTYTLADDPLLRSGLILSGGNYAWSGKTPIERMEDGIATAYEISQLNLSNTDLVVLSACETALGDVKGSEGVFGLQRAFKMAGVKKMIVSLWQVPDKETVELMTSFYTYWIKGKTIEDAFSNAQADMRKKYSPYYWAAFVLVE